MKAGRCQDDEILSFGGDVISSIQQWAHEHCTPLNAAIELTQRCNIRCRHCYNFDRDEPRTLSCEGVEPKPELASDEILALIDSLAAAGCLFLTLTGGEALLHPDLFAFLSRARDRNMAVQLLTNGLLLRPGMASELARYPNLLGVSISLYGATAEVHDGITQSPGSFERTWAGARLVRDRGIAVRLKFIVMKQNAHEVEAMMAGAEVAGFAYTLDLTITARHDGTRGSLETRIEAPQLARLYRGPLRPLLPRGPARTISSEEFACNCARGNCAISAQGDVFPCISVPIAAGNIRQQSFAEIWKSSPAFQRIRALRLEDYPACAPCPHKSWCNHERGAAFTYSGSYTGIDPLVCARAELAHDLADEARVEDGASQAAK